MTAHRNLTASVLFVALSLACLTRVSCSQQHHPTSTPPVLILTVVPPGNIEKTRELLADNVRVLGDKAHWGLVLLRGHAEDWTGLAEVASKAGSKLLVREGRSPADKSYVPKLYLQTQSVEWAREYEMVWMADADISFESFDFEEFMSRHGTAFGKRGSPVIAQPVIAQNTQWEDKMMNLDQWPNADVLAAEVTFIEQQIPILDARFWEWLAPKVTNLASKQLELGTDWGLDHVWCEAAREFGVTRPGCAVIPLPIDHHNSKTIKKSESYNANGHDLLARLVNKPGELVPWSGLQERFPQNALEVVRKADTKLRGTPTRTFGTALDKLNGGVFVVTLPDRRANVDKVLAVLGVGDGRASIVDAVDKTALPMNDLVTRGVVDKDYFETRTNGGAEDFTTGKLACLLSHREVQRRFLQTSLDVAVVLEDDIDAEQLLNDPEANERLYWALVNRPRDTGIVYLGYCYDRGTGASISVVAPHTMYRKSTGALCGHAYVVTRDAAEKYMNHMLPMTQPQDWVLKDIADDTKALIVVPQLLTQGGEFGSEASGFNFNVHPPCATPVVAGLHGWDCIHENLDQPNTARKLSGNGDGIGSGNVTNAPVVAPTIPPSPAPTAADTAPPTTKNAGFAVAPASVLSVVATLACVSLL